MIVVIADDLTGAAELGGLGLKYNLKVEIVTDVNFHSNPDLLIISTDSRSMNKQQAVDEMIRITSLVKDMKPVMIYKKVDSVMRGYILDEITAQLKTLGLTRALLVPANPALGRTILNGKYFIHGQPVHLSSFSSDPEFPVVDSSVINMLGGDKSLITVQKVNGKLPLSGIVVGEANSSDDLDAWAAKADPKSMLLSGAAGFFSSILQTNFSKKANQVEKVVKLDSPYLVVCGSSFNQSRQVIKDIASRGGPVKYMLLEFSHSSQAAGSVNSEWLDEVVSLLTEKGRVVIAFDDGTTKNGQISAKELRENTACIVSEIMKRVNVPELIIEGGSTASAIVKELGFSCFVPVTEYTGGVIRMRVAGRSDLYVTLKPGSYSWPPGLLNFEKTNTC